MNKQIIVLGVMRSGTSLAAGILEKMGVDMGSSRNNGDPQNPNGYFEDRELFALNEKIFRLSNNSDNWVVPEDIVLNIEVLKKIKEIGQREGVWGAKAGMNFTIEHFLPYLSNPYFVITFRNPIENIRSMNEYKGLDKHSCFQLLLKHYQQLEKVMRHNQQVPTYLFNFERAKKDPIKVAEELSEFTGVKIKNKQLIKDFVYVSRYKR